MLPTAASFIPTTRTAPSSTSFEHGLGSPPTTTTTTTHNGNGLFGDSSLSSSSASSSSSSSSRFVSLSSSPVNQFQHGASTNGGHFDQGVRSYYPSTGYTHSLKDSLGSSTDPMLRASSPQRDQSVTPTSSAFSTSSLSSSTTSATGPMWDAAPSSSGPSRPTPIGSGRSTPVVSAVNHSGGLSSSVGAIGDRRRLVSGNTATPEKRMEDAINGLAGVFDINRSSGATSPLQGLGTVGRALTPSPSDGDTSLSLRPGSSSGAVGSAPKSRPSSFILGVLPSRTDDRHRSASERSSSSPLASPAHEKLSFDLDFSNSSIVLSSSPPTSSTSLIAPGGAEATPRAPTPVRSPSPGVRRRPLFGGGGEGQQQTVEARVHSLEATVYDLASFVHGEMRSMRDEINSLRNIVQQLANLAGSGGNPGLYMNSLARYGGTGQHLGLSRTKDLFESPLLTVRSPSPPLQPAPGSRPGLVRSASGSVLEGLGGGFASGSSSPALSSSGRFGSSDQDGMADKDEQIAALSQQVSALASSVAHLMSSSAAPQGSPMLGPGGIGSSVVNRGVHQPGPTGLGVSLSKPSAAVGRSPLMRPLGVNGVPQSGLNRAPSLSKSFVGSRSPNRSNTAPGSEFGEWDSPVIGGQSPMLGGSNGSAPPPGSLGSKWDALGVGNELFRAIAKYGLGPPTKIQAKAIPCVLRSQDIVAQAPAIQERIQCYVIPALQLLHSLSASAGVSPGPSVQVIIITATVDQAAQAQRLAVGLGATLGIRTSLYVGQPTGDSTKEALEWQNAPTQVIVGTPQRLHDLLATRLIPLHDLRLLIIDECDQLIARNLSEHVANVVRFLPPPLTSNGPSSANKSSGCVPPSPVMARSPLLGPSPSALSPLPHAFSPNPSAASPWSQPPTSPAPSTGVDRQTAIYSCTVPQDVLNFASSLQLREPVRVLVRRESAGGGDRGEPTLGGAPNSNGLASSPSPGSVPHSNQSINAGNGSGLPSGVNTAAHMANLRGLRQFFFYVAASGPNSSGNGARRDGSTASNSSRQWKLEALCDVIEDSGVDALVIFTSSMESVEAVTYKLGSRGIETIALHQEMGQPMRQSALARFRAPLNNTGHGNGAGSTPRLGVPNGANSKRCLVVFDPLCRPLTEALQVPLVINFDLPRAVEDYAHRVSAGANSPYGRPGTTINFVAPGPDADMLRAIEAHYRCKIAELPTFGF
ncbi:BQ2448_4802 [Microbotryum intermedium]|uniref:RNA helicase n=1 Tax=Microbotryum intermedium TaxID=269621 RepID=A0A238FLQ5_9BASI|nr:BQ2448_4802 [Microbotryum intermedium]